MPVAMGPYHVCMECGAWVGSTEGVHQCNATGRHSKGNAKGTGGKGTVHRPGEYFASWWTADLATSSPQQLAAMLANELQIDVVKLLGDALPQEQPKLDKPKIPGEGQLYQDMSLARSRYNKAVAKVTKKGKEIEKLKQQLNETEEQLVQAKKDNGEADAHFKELSEKYFTAARGGSLVAETVQVNPLDNEEAPEGEPHEDLDEDLLQVGELSEQEEAAKRELLTKLAKQEQEANKKVEETKRRKTKLQNNLNMAKARKTMEGGDAAGERAKAIQQEGTPKEEAQSQEA